MLHVDSVKHAMIRNWGSGLLAGIGLLVTILPATVFAQAYPSRLVKMTVPFSAGGSIDLLGRLVGKKMEEGLGVTVVIENKGGGGGTIGTKAVLDSKPDGSSIAIVSPGPTTVAAVLDPTLQYNITRDITYIVALASYVPALVAGLQVPGRTLREFIDYAKKNPGKLTFGSAGVGSSTHILGELFVRAAGVDIVHVPFKGGSGGIQDVLGGHISLMITSLVAAQPLINSGKVRALAAFDKERYPTFPTVPAVTEDMPNFDPPIIWYGLIGPAGMPAAITDRLNREAIKAMASAELQKEIINGAYKVIGGSPRDFQELIRKDVTVVGDIVRAAKITLEK